MYHEHCGFLWRAQIIIELQEQGIAFLSGTIVNDKYVMLAAIVNHHSRREDFDVLIQEVTRTGEELAKAIQNTGH